MISDMMLRLYTQIPVSYTHLDVYKRQVKYGSEKAVKEAGRLREEGKEYVVQDGDIMESVSYTHL